MLENKYDIVTLYSGGLDSLLAATFLSRLGLRVLAVHFSHPFKKGLWANAQTFSRNICGFDSLSIPVGDEFLQMMCNPKFGYGKTKANPCMDCKVLFMRKAFAIAKQIGAAGIATGEVVGQRPFSQRVAAMHQIAAEAGVTGFVLRPLCAKLLPPTSLETSGLVNREQLLDFSGRSRERQFALARELGIDKYEHPAGGCKLTDPGYAARVLEARAHNEIDIDTMQLLKFGRHFRLDGHRLAIGREERECDLFEKQFAAGRILFVPSFVPGPSAVLAPTADEQILNTAAKIIARYSQKSASGLYDYDITFENGTRGHITCEPFTADEVASVAGAPIDAS